MAAETQKMGEPVGVPREADEVFVFMGKDFRVSRNARAHWFFDHIDKDVTVEELDFKNKEGTEMSVVGVVPKDGTTSENLIGQKFRVTTETKVVYISRFYRQVYVLELSPSIIVADDETDCCLYNKLLECLGRFTIPGSNSVYEPQIYASVIIFVPFLAFEEDLTLVSGVLLTHDNVDIVLVEVDRKWTQIKERLYRFSQPVMRNWAQIRRRHKSRLDSTCANDSLSTVSSERTGGDNTSSWIRGGLNEIVPDYVIPLCESINAVPKRLFDSTVSGKKRKSTRVEARGEGYIIPELALMFMLRLGLTVVQTMPENTQSNVIIITDGVSGMPAPESLQTILRELRGYTVACSFIEVKGKPICAPCFGHVTSGDLFHFLATATFGGYLPNCLCTLTKRDLTLPEHLQPLNSFHRALLCWSFQSALQENKHIFQSIKTINPGFAELYQQNTDYHVMINTTYTSTLKELLYVRLREGFTLKSIELEEGRVQINLSLPFRPLIVLEYGINASWPITEEKGPVHVDLAVAGPQDEIRDMKLSKSSECVYRANAMRMHLINSLEDCCRRIAFADRIMLHLHSFNLNSYFYAYPKGISHIPLYFKSYVTLNNGEKSDSILVRKFIPRENKEGFSAFLRFWQEVVNLRQDEWQKWVHVHIERTVLYCQPVGNICVKRNHQIKVSCQKAKDAFHQFLLDMNSFCLIDEELYVMFVTKREDGVPSYFYMLRVEQILPYVVMKCAFLGGICSSERRRVVREMRLGLAKLKFNPREDSGEKFVLTTMKRPLERILIMYDKLPENNYLAQWTSTETEEDIFEIPLCVENEKHNAVTKYLEGRRHVWHLPLRISDDLEADPDPYDFQRVRKIADSAVNGLLKRRLNEGFQVAWTKNMIIGLVRQIEVEGRTMLQQYIVFQPVCNRNLDSTLRKENSRPGFLVVTESWNEPCLFGMTPSISTSKRADDDDDFIVCLYTLKYLLLLTTEVTHTSITVAQEVAQVKNGFHIFPRISYVQNPFNFHTLLKYSRRLLLHLPTFEIGDDPTGELRNAVFSTAFYSEFGRYSNVYFDVPDPKVIAMLLTQMFFDKKDTAKYNAEQFDKQGFDDRYQCKCRIFVKGIDMRNCLIMVVPSEDRISEDKRSWPVIVAIGDGVLTQDCMAIEKCPSKVLEHRMKRMSMSRPDDKSSPTDDDLDNGEVLRLGTEEDLNRESSGPIGMRQIVGEMRDAILERATVSALFKCLKLGKGGSLDREDVSWILDELCDYTNVELYCVPEAIEKFCEHLKKERKDTSCCDPSTLQAIFANVLKFKNFAPIPTDPNYYFFNAETCVPKELVRRNNLLVETNLPVLALLHPGGKGPTYPVKCRIPNGRKSQKQKQQIDCPLFIFFHCVLQLPNGEEEYVPVNYLPSCVNQVLQSAGKHVPARDLHKVRVKLLVYVLTWPRQMKDDYDEGVETNPIDFIGRAKKFLSKLPFNERDTIRETISWMNRSLRLESLLVSEKPVDQIAIETASDFITDIVGKTYCDFSKEGNDRNFLAPQVRQRFRSLKFVIPSTNAFETLLKRLDGKTVEYCTLRRIENSKFFYIYRAENKKGFERHLKDHYLRKIRGEEKRQRHDSNSGRSLSRTESESSVFSSSPRMEITHEMEQALEKARVNAANFWVILSIEKTVSLTDCEEIMVKLQFCERYACEPSQHRIYSNTWTETRAEIRKINQEILLENMFYTRNCSQFLLTKEDKKGKNSDEEDEEDGSLDLSLAHTANYDFAPGSLACPLVWEYWIKVHPRLRRKHKYGHLHEVAVLLRRSFEQHMVSNVPNTFVFRGEDGYILYGQIYSSFDQFFKSGKQYSLDLENVREKVKERFEGEEKSLLFAGFGVSKPPDSLRALIADGLIEKKLSEQVLENIVDIFKRNPRALLEPFDVEFMQPDPRKPATMFYFSIPMIMKKFTSAVLYYQSQHLSFNNIEEARLRDSLQSGSLSKQRPFKSYPTIVIPGEPSNQKYDPTFLLYNRFKEKGSKDFGMAVLEMRIVNEKGSIDKPCDGLIRLESHKSLVPNLDDPNTVFEWFEAMTTTNWEQVDPRLQPEQQPKPPTPVPNTCGYIQVIVWQIGDVGLTHLQQILTTVIEASFLDVVTEYGILNTDIVEASAPLIPPPSPSAVTPTKLKTPLSAQKLTSAKKRDSTETVHLSGIQTPTPLTADAAKRGSAVFTYEPIRRGSNHEIMARDDFVLPIPRVPEHLSSHFMQFSNQWLEFISIRPDSQFTYRKAEFKLRHSVLVQQTLNQIEYHIRQSVKSADPVLNDRIQVFQNVNKGTNDQPRYDLVSLPLFDEKATDTPPKEHYPRYLMLSYSEDVNRETRRYGYEIAKNQSDAPTALVRLADTNKDCKWLYLPNIEETFIPRQTILIIKEHNDIITLFTYNFLPAIHNEIAYTIFRMVMWQNAKYRLYEHIVEHPLDPVLPPVPEDWRTVGNSYVTLIGLHPDLLLEVNAPLNSLSGLGVLISSEIAQRLFRFRRSYTAQVVHVCPVQRAFQQFKEMRKEVKQQVYAYQSNKVMYDNLSEENNEVAEEQLQTMWGHCRRVHYVQTPVLLSPAWRRKIAQVRRGVNETPVVKLKQLTTTVSQLTSMSRSRAGTMSGALSRQQTLPTKTKEEEELYDPCHIKMLHDLTEEYVEFLGEMLHLKLLNVVELSEKSREQHRYKMEYPQGGRKPPDVCLFKKLMHGILLVRLHFVPPYFIMSVGMWASPELLLRDQTLTERESKEYLGELERAKDQVVSKSHMHSFTYDFHLRMISRYLIHKEVLFPNGYNTSTFLVDFLKYYACRPPSARNCVYEERNTFNLHRNVDSSTVWTCFLEKNYEEKYHWKVLRIRITDEETEHASTFDNEYMLASCVEGPKSDGYTKVCVLLLDRRKKETVGSISLAQYMILVDQNRNRPLEESRQREDSSKSNVGEFRSVPLAPTEEQLNKEVNDMLAFIEEGGMPTVEGMVTRRRRFSSGSHTSPMQSKSGDTESGLHSPVLMHGSESDTNVPVQGDPTLRHRKHGAGSNDEGEIPGEKANYIQYISNGQRRLQLLLEDTTNEYSDIIKNAVDQANRECLREILWRKVNEIPRSLISLSRLGSQVRLGSSGEIWNSLRSIQHSDGQHIIELCDLVKRESMKDREQRLKELVGTANCARLCRFLVYYFGPVRCRVFESPQPKTSNRSDVSPDQVLGQPVVRHLLITNPDNPIVFLVRCEEETSPDLIILFKKDISQLATHFHSLLDKAFDEIVQSVTAFIWSDLIYRPPGKST